MKYDHTKDPNEYVPHFVVFDSPEFPKPYGPFRDRYTAWKFAFLEGMLEQHTLIPVFQ